MGNASSSPEGYNSSTNAEDIAKGKDLSNFKVLITGSNTGIGKETTRVLYKNGANVIMACRDTKKMNEAADYIRNSCKDDKTSKVGTIECFECDLADLTSVEKFADEMIKKDFPLNTLILNAGVMIPPLMRTKQGFELQIGVNHFGHFALTMKLLELMKKHCDNNNKGRIVCVSSEGHKFGTIDLNDINYEKRSYSAMKAYGQSKLANILFARELNRLLQMNDETKCITTHVLHPGVIKTELGRYSKVWGAVSTVGGVFMKSIPQGAATTVYCAIGDGLDKAGGNYYYDCHVGKTTAYGDDMTMAKNLWDLSEKLTKVKYPFTSDEQDTKKDETTEITTDKQ